MSWLSTPSPQDTPHYWAVTYLGHFFVGLSLFFFLLCTPQTIGWVGCIIAASLAYSLWELVQLKKYDADLLDCIVDWSAATLGAVFAAGLWTKNLPLSGVAEAITLLILVIGMQKKAKEK